MVCSFPLEVEASGHLFIVGIPRPPPHSGSITHSQRHPRRHTDCLQPPPSQICCAFLSGFPSPALTKTTANRTRVGGINPAHNSQLLLLYFSVLGIELRASLTLARQGFYHLSYASVLLFHLTQSHTHLPFPFQWPLASCQTGGKPGHFSWMGDKQVDPIRG
jgi:hypothetical protein